MSKEWRLLISNWWQVLLYLLAFGVLLAMGISVTSDDLMSGLEREEFAALEGPYDQNLVSSINKKYGFYKVQRESNQVSYGSEEEPHLVLERFYGQSYFLDLDRLQKIAETKPEVSDRAEHLLANLQFFYTNGWQNYFAALASPTPTIPISSIFIVAIIVLGASQLGLEYLQGTWLVIGNTIHGRHGILIRKYLVLVLTGLGTMLIVHLCALLNLQSSGQLNHAGRHISEMLNTVPFWDMTFIGAALINILFWVLAVLLLGSIILLLSAVVKNSLSTIIYGLLCLLGIPVALNAVLPMRPLIFPQNIIGMVQILMSPGIGNDKLVQFLKWRPWLPESTGLVFAYAVLLPIILIVIFMRLSYVITRRWY